MCILLNVWGPHTIDRFASDYNTTCVFNSKYWCPGTTGINAFDQHWGQENNWIVPPPSVAQKYKALKYLLFVFSLHDFSKYISILSPSCVNCVDSVLSAVYGIKRAHNLQGVQDPTDNSFVHNLVETEKRQPRQPKSMKDHVTTESLDSVLPFCISF
jgi:hypothetical protein